MRVKLLIFEKEQPAKINLFQMAALVQQQSFSFMEHSQRLYPAHPEDIF